MHIDQRLEAIGLNLDLMSGILKDLLAQTRQNTEHIRQDSENIRALGRIAEIHERRLTQ